MREGGKYGDRMPHQQFPGLVQGSSDGLEIAGQQYAHLVPVGRLRIRNPFLQRLRDARGMHQSGQGRGGEFSRSASSVPDCCRHGLTCCRQRLSSRLLHREASLGAHVVSRQRVEPGQVLTTPFGHRRDRYGAFSQLQDVLLASLEVGPGQDHFVQPALLVPRVGQAELPAVRVDGPVDTQVPGFFLDKFRNAPVDQVVVFGQGLVECGVGYDHMEAPAAREEELMLDPVGLAEIQQLANRGKEGRQPTVFATRVEIESQVDVAVLGHVLPGQFQPVGQFVDARCAPGVLRIEAGQPQFVLKQHDFDAGQGVWHGVAVQSRVQVESVEDAGEAIHGLRRILHHQPADAVVAGAQVLRVDLRHQVAEFLPGPVREIAAAKEALEVLLRVAVPVLPKEGVRRQPQKMAEQFIEQRGVVRVVAKAHVKRPPSGTSRPRGPCPLAVFSIRGTRFPSVHCQGGVHRPHLCNAGAECESGTFHPLI